jgi:uncharacterized protein (DUF362 family)
MSRFISRRKFLQITGQAGIYLGLRAGLPRQLKEAFAAEKSLPPFDLAVVQGPAAPAVSRAIELLGGIGRWVKKGDRVVLKPNIGFPNPPEQATTTSPEVVREVASLCHQAGAKQILVLDHPIRRPEICLERSGIKLVGKGIPGTNVFTLSDEKFFQEVPVSRGKSLSRVKIMKAVLEADVFINLPVAKTHGGAGVSLGMKNLMGIIWDRGSFHVRYGLHQAIADLSTVIRPHLIILDASRALVDGGPGGPGKVENLQKIVVGVDPVAVDAYGVGLAEWYGRKYSASQIQHILSAHQLGIGEIDTKKLKIKQETL